MQDKWLLATQMKKALFVIFLIISTVAYGQEPERVYQYSDYAMPEILYGNTAEPNDSFPTVKRQKAFLLSFGKHHTQKSDEWAYRLNYPRTGITFSINDYGNYRDVGYSASALSFIEFDLFRRKKKDLKVNVALGASYFNQRLTRNGNYINKGVSTALNWSFKTFFYYEFLKTKRTAYRIGAGYFHHSNGHTRLPNQGFNSFMLSASAQIHDRNLRDYLPADSILSLERSKTRQWFYSVRTGVGQNVLTVDRNDRREVYSVAVSGGQIINKTYKIGLGFFYRFYEGYYEYIDDNGPFITELYPVFKEDPFMYASNYGVFGSAELLLNHVAIEFNLGLNIHKPFYPLEYQLNQGVTYYINGVFFEELGELDAKYKKKQLINSRLGLKYYVIGQEKSPRHNFFISANLNANLGQADFSELSIGYVHGFAVRKK